MYIKYFFKHETTSKSEKDYKALLKEITTLDVRKISKLNLLAIYGAIKTLKDKEYKKDLSLYAASNFACIQETYKILQELSGIICSLLTLLFAGVAMSLCFFSTILLMISLSKALKP